MIEFQAVRCPKPCGAVVMDCFGLRGIARTLCPKCGKRVTIHGDGHTFQVTQIDRKPPRMPVPSLV